jgi:hypothetical protein
MTSRERVWRTLKFEGVDRLPVDLPGKWGTDFANAGMSPSPDHRPQGGNGVDEWGAVWNNIGVCKLGEVSKVPLERWEDWAKLPIPDVNDEQRWREFAGARQRAGEKFLLVHGISIYERVHFIRGLENTWADIYENPEELGRLIDVLVEMNLAAIARYATEKPDGYIFCDDWGLQNRLMISPEKWREIWKPRYARIFEAAHAAGMANFLHSCGHIVDILDDLIEIGLDAIHMDQQANMGLELLGQRFGGRLTFFSPVDIQMAMQQGEAAIRAYARQMARHLATDCGGWIPRWYTDPTGAGHSEAAIEAMCDEFTRINDAWPQSRR